jgi:hypothetical protein
VNEKDPVIEAAMQALESAFQAQDTAPVLRVGSRNTDSGPTAEHDSMRCERARTVLASLPDLPGMSFWLQYEQPAVWARCQKLLCRCDAVWSAPLSVFEQALAELDFAFREAFELYRVHLQKYGQGVLEGLQAAKPEDKG